MKLVFHKCLSCPVYYIEQRQMTSSQILKRYKQAMNQGLEGIVLTNPSSKYTRESSLDRVKLKSRLDAEGTLVSFNIKDGEMKSMVLSYNKAVLRRSSERCSSPLVLSAPVKTFLSLPAFR